MAGSDLQITINIDSRGATQGADQTKSALAGLVSQFQALGSGLGQLGKDLSGGLEGVRKVSSALDGLSKGAKQALSASGPLRTLTQDISALAGKAASGGSGIARLGSDIATGLSEGVGEGAGKLALLGEAASGVAGIALAVGQAALMAGKATLEWAQQSQNSANATAQQKERASALVNAWNGLNQAADKVSGVFDSIGASLANAFAPAVSAAITLTTDLAQRFTESYASGGLLKSAVDLVNGAIDTCSKAIAATIDWWKTEIDVASDFARLGSDAVKAVTTIVEDLATKLHSALSPAFQAVQSAAATAWNGIRGGFDSLLNFIKIGYEAWKAVNQPLVAAINGIGAAFGAVQSAVQSIVQTIITWIDKLAEAVLRFLEKMPGLSAAFKQIRDDLSRTFGDAQNNFRKLEDDIGGGGRGLAAPAAPVKNGGSTHQLNAGGQSSPGVAQSGKVGGADTCDCDPGIAIACETTAQVGRTTVVTQEQARRVADHADANKLMGASDSETTVAFANDQAQQTNVAKDADRAKAQSNQAANRQMSEANDKTLKQFESSMKSLVNTFASGLARMAEGTESFGKVMRQVGQRILDDVFRVVSATVEKWAWGVTEQVLASTQGQALLNALGLRELAAEIANEHKKTAAVLTGLSAQNAARQAGATQGLAISGQAALKDITNSAAQAASGAYEALSKVPIVGPILGAAAAATVFAAVMAFQGLVTTAAGGYDIPAGVNPLTQLHAQEMVLPARLANPMRDMLASFGSGAAPSAGGHTFSFGDTHIHGAPNMSPADFRQALAEHRASVAEAVASALHGGWRPSYRQPVGAL